MPTAKKLISSSSVAWFTALLVVIGGAVFYSSIVTVKLDAQLEQYRLLDEHNQLLADHIASLERLLKYKDTRDGRKIASDEAMKPAKREVYNTSYSSSERIANEAKGLEKAKNPIVIQVGSTTAAEVKNLLGKPSRMGRYDRGSSNKTIWCTYWIYGKVGIYFDGSDETAKVREIKGDIDAYISNRFGP